jgi:hypothetical protein
MNGGVLLSFNFANMVTVLLIVGLGFALLGFGAKIYQQKAGANS